MWLILVLLITLLVYFEFPQFLRKVFVAQKVRWQLKLPNVPGREFFFGHCRLLLWLSPGQYYYVV